MRSEAKVRGKETKIARVPAIRLKIKRKQERKREGERGEGRELKEKDPG